MVSKAENQAEKKRQVSAKIRQLKQKTGLTAKELRKAFPNSNHLRESKIKGIRKKTREREKQRG